MPLSRAASALVYLRRVPDEPVPDDAAGLRAANARLRAVVEAKDGQVAMLTAALDAALERERRLGLRLAEVERRLGDGQHGLRDAFLEGADRGERGQAGALATTTRRHQLTNPIHGPP